MPVCLLWSSSFSVSEYRTWRRAYHTLQIHETILFLLRPSCIWLKVWEPSPPCCLLVQLPGLSRNGTAISSYAWADCRQTFLSWCARILCPVGMWVFRGGDLHHPCYHDRRMTSLLRIPSAEIPLSSFLRPRRIPQAPLHQICCETGTYKRLSGVKEGLLESIDHWTQNLLFHRNLTSPRIFLLP